MLQLGVIKPWSCRLHVPIGASKTWEFVLTHWSTQLWESEKRKKQCILYRHGRSVSMHVCVYVSMSGCLGAHVRLCLCVYFSMCYIYNVSIYLCMDLSIYIYHMYTCICLCVSVNVSMYVILYMLHVLDSSAHSVWVYQCQRSTSTQLNSSKAASPQRPAPARAGPVARGSPQRRGNISESVVESQVLPEKEKVSMGNEDQEYSQTDGNAKFEKDCKIMQKIYVHICHIFLELGMVHSVQTASGDG